MSAPVHIMLRSKTSKLFMVKLGASQVVKICRYASRKIVKKAGMRPKLNMTSTICTKTQLNFLYLRVPISD